MPLTESQLEAKIVAYAKSRGCLAYKFSSPARRGVPDRIIVAPGGRILFLEVKREGERPTALQEREIRLLREQGCDAEWCDCLPVAKACIDSLLK
jgi:Holliday junction resolvase